jgi:uncharacterized protein
MPELSQSFTLAFPRAEVWRAFHAIERVVACMPGASLDQPPEGNKLRGQMRVKLGPVAAAFAGEAELQMDDAEWTGIISGKGLDQKNNSRTRADLRFRLSDAAPGTRVDVTVDYSLAGPLAQFGRGSIVQGIAQRITEEFARNLATEMGQQAAFRGPPEPAAGAPPAAKRELNILGLLWSSLMAWLRRSLGGLAWWRH